MLFSEPETHFKTCTMCGQSWPHRDIFLADPAIEFLGYMPVFSDPDSGLLMFNHECQSTLSLSVGTFSDLVAKPAYPLRQTGSKHCPGHCLSKESIDPCDAECRCAYVRGIIQTIRNWPKWEPVQTAWAG